MNKKNTIFKKQMAAFKVTFYKEALIRNGLDVTKTARELGVTPPSLRTMLFNNGISLRALSKEVCKLYSDTKKAV